MVDLPILFSAPMVRALISGTKTQTRRTLGRLRRFGVIREFGISDTPGYAWHFRDRDGRWHDLRGGEILNFLPYKVGDRLYVREAHHRTNDSETSHLIGYDTATDPNHRAPYSRTIESVGEVEFWPHSLGGWGGRASKDYPAMHMPRWASRITLIVEGVKIERVQDISEEDAIAEGIERGSAFFKDYSGDGSTTMMFPSGSFMTLWKSINGAGSWDANPFIVAYTFRRIMGNIDNLLVAA